MAAEGALREGAEASVSLLVAPQHTARAVQSGSVDVFATPELIRLLEMG
jgi:predicted thioesterase